MADIERRRFQSIARESMDNIREKAAGSIDKMNESTDAAQSEYQDTHSIPGIQQSVDLFKAMTDAETSIHQVVDLVEKNIRQAGGILPLPDRPLPLASQPRKPRK